MTNTQSLSMDDGGMFNVSLSDELPNDDAEFSGTIKRANEPTPEHGTESHTEPPEIAADPDSPPPPEDEPEASPEDDAAHFISEDDDGEDAEEAAPILPYNMFVQNGWLAVKNNDKTERVSTHFDVLACTKDENGGNYGRYLRIYRDDGEHEDLAFPMAELNGERLIPRLMAAGVRLEQINDKALRYLRGYVSESSLNHFITCVTRTGWSNKNEHYVFPTGIYPPTDNLVLQADRNNYPSIKTSGTLEEWQEHVAKPCQGNHRLIFALSTALSGTIAPLLVEEGGGINLHGGSSIGKTTGLRVAASVIGSPEYKMQWRATDNAVEGVCAEHNHMTLIFDELGQVNDNIMEDMTYMIFNGQGKRRMTKRLVVEAPRRFQVMVISSGELSIANKIRRSGKRVNAGALIRFIDVPADAGKGLGIFDTLNGAESASALSEHLQLMTNKYYGTAITAFIEYIVTVQDGLKARFNDFKERFVADVVEQEADGQIHRVAGRTAMIALAGELAIEAGILPYQVGAAREAAIVNMNAWLDQRGGQVSAEEIEALRKVKLYIEQYQHLRFREVDIDGVEVTNQREMTQLAGWRRPVNRSDLSETEMNNVYFFIQPETFEQDVCDGLNHTMVCRVLYGHGLLWREGERNKRRYIVLKDGTKQPFYIVHSNILEL